MLKRSNGKLAVASGKKKITGDMTFRFELVEGILLWDDGPLVHGRPIVSPQGIVVPLVNWSLGHIVGLNVSLTLAALKPGMVATLASGGAVRAAATDGGFEIAELGVADALVLRYK